MRPWVLSQPAQNNSTKTNKAANDMEKQQNKLQAKEEDRAFYTICNEWDKASIIKH